METPLDNKLEICFENVFLGRILKSKHYSLGWDEIKLNKT